VAGRRWRSRTPLALLAGALAACSGRDAQPGATCADVGELRVCWEGAAIRADARAAACADRACTSRAAGAPPFSCAGARCEQRHPRMPDDGEWQCADSGGVTICSGGERAAGVAPAPPEAGWWCGPRSGASAWDGERVCVDLSPDFPDGHMRGWRCTTRYEGPVRRECERDPGARTLTEPCDARRPCLDGSRCAQVPDGDRGGGRCVPERPAPACWLPGDCASGRCRFGSCVEGGA
jgi:hypothetical protein